MNDDQAEIREFLFDCIHNHNFADDSGAEEEEALEHLAELVRIKKLDKIIEQLREFGILDAKADSVLQVLLYFQCDDHDQQIALLERAIALYPENFEARYMLAARKEQLPSTEQINILRSYLSEMKKQIAQDVYDDNMGRFNEDHFLLPYLRMNYCLFENLSLAQQFAEAVAVAEYLLELDEADEFDITLRLPALYLATGQFDNATLAVQSLRAESEALFLWAVFFEKVHTKKEEELDDALRDATKSNKFVFRYLINDDFEAPEYTHGPFKPGSRQEAFYILDTLAPAINTGQAFFEILMRVIRDNIEFFNKFVQDKSIVENFKLLSTFTDAELVDLSTHIRQSVTDEPEPGEQLELFEADDPIEAENIVTLHPQQRHENAADAAQDVMNGEIADIESQIAFLRTANEQLARAADSQIKKILALCFISVFADNSKDNVLRKKLSNPIKATQELIRYFEGKSEEECLAAMRQDGMLNDQMESLIYSEMAYQTENLDSALQLYKKALSLNPENPEAKFQVLDLSNKLEEHERIVLLKSLCKVFEDEIGPQLHGLMGKNKYILHWQAYLRLSYALLTSYLELGQYEAGLKVVEGVMALNTEDLRGLPQYLPILHLCCGNKKEARVTLRELKNSGENEGLYLWLDFLAKLLLNNKPGANTAFRKAIKFNPIILGFILGEIGVDDLDPSNDASHSPPMLEAIDIVDMLIPLLDCKKSAIERSLPRILAKNIDFVEKHFDL